MCFSDNELKQQIQEDAGIEPHFPMESFSDLEEDARQSIARIQHSPFLLVDRGWGSWSSQLAAISSSPWAKTTKS